LKFGWKKKNCEESLELFSVMKKRNGEEKVKEFKSEKRIRI
jgi:hypothetical protein